MSNQLDDVLAQVDEVAQEGEHEAESAELTRVADQPAVVTEMPTPPLELLEADEPICEGGPTRTQIEELKKKLPVGTMLMFTALAGNKGILWKTVNRGEWKSLMAQVRTIEDETKREDFIFAKITLFPDCKDHTVIDTLPGGAVTLVMQDFYVHSGFTALMDSLQL